MSTQYPPLPHRRLKMMANGIWDEVNKAFYPYRVSSVTVAAKPGIRYYVHQASCTGYATGINAVALARYVRGVVNKVTTNFINIVVPVMTQATDYFSFTSTSIINVLCDANAAITMSASYGSVIYAEIPDDLGWVVIE